MHQFTLKPSLPCWKYQFLLPSVLMPSEWTDGIWRSCGKMQTCDLHIWTKNAVFICILDICSIERNIHKIKSETIGWSYRKGANFHCLSRLFLFAMKKWEWYMANLPSYSPSSFRQYLCEIKKWNKFSCLLPSPLKPLVSKLLHFQLPPHQSPSVGLPASPLAPLLSAPSHQSSTSMRSSPGHNGDHMLKSTLKPNTGRPHQIKPAVSGGDLALPRGVKPYLSRLSDTP